MPRKPTPESDTIKCLLGKRVKQERLKAGYSQRELSEKSGVYRSTLCNVEWGKGCSVWTLFQLAGAFEIEPGDLLNFRMLE